MTTDTTCRPAEAKPCFQTATNPVDRGGSLPLRHIAIPVKTQPESLFLCLESLSRADGIENYVIDFRVGVNPDPEIDYVLKKFHKLHNRLQYTITHSDRAGMEYDVSKACLDAAKESDWFIFLCGDMIVSKDFLRVAEYVAEHFYSEDLITLSTKGLHINRAYRKGDQVYVVDRAQLHFIANQVFSAAFNRYVRPYVREEYWNSSTTLGELTIYDESFFEANFGHAQRGCGFDGLVAAAAEKHNLRCLKTLTPRSSEIGWGGVHKYKNLPKYNEFKAKNLADRIAWLRERIAAGDLADYFPDNCREEYLPLCPDWDWTGLKLIAPQPVNLPDKFELRKKLGLPDDKLLVLARQQPDSDFNIQTSLGAFLRFCRDNKTEPAVMVMLTAADKASVLRTWGALRKHGEPDNLIIRLAGLSSKELADYYAACDMLMTT